MASCSRRALGRSDPTCSQLPNLTGLFPLELRVIVDVAVLGRPETEWKLIVKEKKSTRYPGVFRLDQTTYWIRAKVVDPRTGLDKEFERVLEGVTAHEAAQKRDDLINEILHAVQRAQKQRVGEFARSWLESKALKIDPTTVRTYADAWRTTSCRRSVTTTTTC